jgi:hypothetical protein
VPSSCASKQLGNSTSKSARKISSLETIDPPSISLGFTTLLFDISSPRRGGQQPAMPHGQSFPKTMFVNIHDAPDRKPLGQS